MKMTKSMRVIALVLMMALVLTMMFIININTVTANALGDGTTVEEPHVHTDGGGITTFEQCVYHTWGFSMQGPCPGGTGHNHGSGVWYYGLRYCMTTGCPEKYWTCAKGSGT